jgi:hypothetical protein
VGLLLGSIQRERKRPLQNRNKARTSLSSLPSDDEYCQVAKVHCIWEPTQQPSSQSDYDASQMIHFDQTPTTRRVLELAQALGLVPVGWIFTYSDAYRRQQKEAEEGNGGAKSRKKKKSKSSDNDSNDDDNNNNNHKPPLVLGQDVVTGAQLEMAKMKWWNHHYHHSNDDNHDDGDGRIEGKKFVTLAMDATTGATEAVQLSDVSVQMVSEGVQPQELQVQTHGGFQFPTCGYSGSVHIPAHFESISSSRHCAHLFPADKRSIPKDAAGNEKKVQLVSKTRGSFQGRFGKEKGIVRFPEIEIKMV